MGAGESKTSFRQAVNLLDENKDLWEQLDWEKITSIQVRQKQFVIEEYLIDHNVIDVKWHLADF